LLTRGRLAPLDRGDCLMAGGATLTRHSASFIEKFQKGNLVFHCRSRAANAWIGGHVGRGWIRCGVWCGLRIGLRIGIRFRGRLRLRLWNREWKRERERVLIWIWGRIRVRCWVGQDLAQDRGFDSEPVRQVRVLKAFGLVVGLNL